MKNYVIPIKIYLAGYINGKVLDKCIKWRQEIVNHYEHWKGSNDYPIVFLDPLNSKDYEDISEDGCTAKGIDSNAIIHRDYNCVMKSDIIIANMNMFGQDRVPFGTISEIAWGWDHKKPVIIISEDEMYHNHPFSKYFASFIVKDVKELLDRKILNYFFKGWNSAIY